MKPVLQALVLAEHIYQDVSGKKVICGTFNQVRFSTKPLAQQRKTAEGETVRVIPGGVQGGSPYAYLSLTDVVDETALVFQFVNLTLNQTLFTRRIVIKDVNRLATIELVLPLPHLGISKAGVYAFEIVCEGEIIGSYRISASEFDLTQPEQHSE